MENIDHNEKLKENQKSLKIRDMGDQYWYCPHCGMITEIWYFDKGEKRMFGTCFCPNCGVHLQYSEGETIILKKLK